MTQALVICANDSVEHVVIGSMAEATALLEKLAREAFDRNPWNYRGQQGWVFTGKTPYEKYRNHVYWHIHTVPLTENGRATHP